MGRFRSLMRERSEVRCHSSRWREVRADRSRSALPVARDRVVSRRASRHELRSSGAAIPLKQPIVQTRTGAGFYPARFVLSIGLTKRAPLAHFANRAFQARLTE